MTTTPTDKITLVITKKTIRKATELALALSYPSMSSLFEYLIEKEFQHVEADVKEK